MAETSGDARTFEIFKNKTHFDSEELLKEYEKLRMGIMGETEELEKSFNVFANSLEKELKKVFVGIDVNKLNDAQKDFIRIQSENFATTSELGENAKKLFNEFIDKNMLLK